MGGGGGGGGGLRAGPRHGVDRGHWEEGLDRGQPAGGVRLLQGSVQRTENDSAGVQTRPHLSPPLQTRVGDLVGHGDVLLAHAQSRLSLLGRR